MLLAAAFAATVFGLAVLAASMQRHWRQLRGAAPLTAGVAVSMRLVGGGALLLSLLLCLANDHPTMGVLVWIMLLALAAVLVAMTLAWRTATPVR